MMNLPEQERFTVEDIAARWQKSVSYVLDVLRRGLLPKEDRLFSRGFTETKPRKFRLEIKTWVVLKDLERFEQNCGLERGSWKEVKAAMTHFDKTDRTIRRWAEDKKVKSRRGPGNRLQIFCPADL